MVENSTRSVSSALRGLKWVLILGGVLITLFGVPWATIFIHGAGWSEAAIRWGTVGFLVPMLALVPLMVAGHRLHWDGAARVGSAILGVIWVLFAQAVLGNVLRGALWLGGVREPFRSDAMVLYIVVASAILLVWGFIEAKRLPRIREVCVEMPRLPVAFEGVRVVQLSDLHYGAANRTRWSERVVSTVNALDADIVCLTGDIADGTVDARRAQAAPLQNVHAKLARVYAVGNHEHYHHAHAWMRHLESLGWDTLYNRHIVVHRGGESLTIAGVDDASASEDQAEDLASALDGAAEDAPVMVLAHQPSQVKTTAAFGVDLHLAGHTHGGQMWPFNLLVRLDQPVVHGLSRHGDRTWLYTSRGTGYWGPPFRIFAPSEITVLTLHRRASNSKA